MKQFNILECNMQVFNLNCDWIIVRWKVFMVFFMEHICNWIIFSAQWREHITNLLFWQNLDNNNI